MNICMVGATGKSGRRLVGMALDRGHGVTALVRNPAKLADLAHERLTARAVSLADKAALVGVLKNHDAVINAAGYVTDGPAYISLVASIIDAADTALGQGGRFWLFGGAALLDIPGTSTMTLDLPGIPKIFEAHRTNFERVKRTSLDWSMLCPGPMFDAPDGKPTKGLIVSPNVWPVPRPGYTYVLPRLALSLAFKNSMPQMTIYYEDAANVILDNLVSSGALSRKRVGIALQDERRHKNTRDLA